MKKKGDVWVSAILYTALGVVLLTIILAAGLPVIQKMKDSYTAKHTKELMLVLDSNVKTVYHEGPGSQRAISLDIGRGEFVIDGTNEVIKFNFESSALISEVDSVVEEGNLQILSKNSGVKGKYDIELMLNYSGSGLELNYTGPQIISGKSDLFLFNQGGTENITIGISQI
nr:hypothetical protein [Nanoarchaeum sp.]